MHTLSKTKTLQIHIEIVSQIKPHIQKTTQANHKPIDTYKNIKHTLRQIYTKINTHTHTLKHIYTQTNTHAHTHTHTYTQKDKQHIYKNKQT